MMLYNHAVDIQIDCAVFSVVNKHLSPKSKSKSKHSTLKAKHKSKY